MKALLALLLLTTSAVASDLTVSVGPISETWTLSPEDQAKFDAWVQSAYKCPPPGLAGTELPACDPSKTSKAAQLTLEQAQLVWAKVTLQGTLNNVNSYHQRTAATDAAGGVPPVKPQSEKSLPMPPVKK